MRDVYEVLRKKERAVERLHREITALRVVAALLADDADLGPAFRVEPSVRTVAGAQRVRSQEPLRTAETPAADESDRLESEIASEMKLGAAKRISNRLKRLATPLLSAVISLADSSSS